MADVTTTTQLPQNLQNLLDQYWSTSLGLGNSMVNGSRPMPQFDPSYQVPGPNWLMSATVQPAYDILNRSSPGMQTVDSANVALQGTMGGQFYGRDVGRNPYEGMGVTPDRNPYAGSNTYLDQMIQKGQGDIANSFREGTQANLKAMAARANAFGGSGYNDATARNERQLADTLANYNNSMRFQDYTTQQGLAESGINRSTATNLADLQRNAALAGQQMSTNEQGFQNERARTLAAAGMSPQMAGADIASLAPASGVGQSMYNIQQQQNQAQMRNDLQTAYPEMAAMDVWKNALGGPMGTTTTQSGGNNSNPWAQVIGGLGTGWALGNMFNLW